MVDKFSRSTLNETKPFLIVKPLHDGLLSHMLLFLS